MRVLPIISTVVVVGLVIYAGISMWGIAEAIKLPAPVAAPKPLPLAKAAPEVASLRPAFRDLATTARQVVPLCPNRDSEGEPARPRGKILVWDVDENDVSEAHGRLDAELRLQSADEPCTVYLITERDRQFAMDYNYDVFHGGGSSGVKGYRTDLVVCAVDLPSLQPRGRYWINGNGPPQYADAKPGLKEIDEDWAGNLKAWLDTCVRGPEARYYNPPQQSTPRHADEARAVLDQCEVLGSLPTLANLPGEAIVWNPQTDRWHPANDSLWNRPAGDKRLLMVMVLDDEFVADRATGRFDYRVALVSFPGAQPLGVYGVRGDSWPLPRQPGETWGKPDRMDRQPYCALADWANHFCQGKRGLPPRTLPITADAMHLAGAGWLKGPGWTK